jgi:predicted nuclease with TOPRIM domain
VKEEITTIQKSIEQLRTNTSDNIMQNRELIRKLREKNNSHSKDFSTSINSMKEKIASLEEKMGKMYEDIDHERLPWQ